MYADGEDRAELAEAFGVHVDTVSRWLKRKDLQALITQLREQRINRITRKIDAAIDQRLRNPEAIETELLLKIRKELTPQRIEVGKAGDFNKSEAELDAWAVLDAGEDVPELPAAGEEVVDGELVEDGSDE